MPLALETLAMPAAPAPPSPAARVTAFVHTALALRVLTIEDAVATANRQVLAYCAARHVGLGPCFEQDVDFHAPATLALAQILTQQALVLTGASHDLSLLLAPQIGDQPADQQMVRIVEDLALCADQSAGLLQEHTTTIATMARNPLTNATSDVGTALGGLSYGPRMRSLARILRRAQDWLDTIDHETGARATLPGFDGSASLDEQLDLP
jgi:hypothetical protein